MTRKQYNEIKGRIENGTYKMVRLCNGKGEVIISYNKVSTKDNKFVLERFEYIKLKIDKDLEPGEYQVQCKVTPNNNKLVDVYKIVKTESTAIIINDVEDKTNEQEEDMSGVDIKEHIKIIKENAENKALIKFLEMERDHYQKLYNSLAKTNPALSDGNPAETTESTAKIVTTGVTDALAGMMGLAEKWFEQGNKKLELEEKKLTSGKVKINKTMNTTKKKFKTIEQQAEEVADAMQELYEANPDQYEEEMDSMQDNNPELYELVCSILGVEEEGDEEEEE